MIFSVSPIDSVFPSIALLTHTVCEEEMRHQGTDEHVNEISGAQTNGTNNEKHTVRNVQSVGQSFHLVTVKEPHFAKACQLRRDGRAESVER